MLDLKLQTLCLSDVFPPIRSVANASSSQSNRGVGGGERRPAELLSLLACLDECDAEERQLPL
jgi:hypothetical protein